MERTHSPTGHVRKASRHCHTLGLLLASLLMLMVGPGGLSAFVGDHVRVALVA